MPLVNYDVLKKCSCPALNGNLHLFIWKSSQFSAKLTNNILTVLREILLVLYKAGATINLRKCSFFTAAINELCYAIQHHSLELASFTKEAIRELISKSPIFPTSLAKLRSILNLLHVFRKFVPSLVQVASLLNQHLKNLIKHIFFFNWEGLQAMENLKNALIVPPVLLLFSSSAHLTLATEARNVQIGCLLLSKEARQQEKTHWVLVSLAHGQ